MDINKSNVKVDDLRFIPVATIDAMINQIVTANKSVFEMYFHLLQIKEANKISVKPIEVAEGVPNETCIEDSNNDKS